MTALHVSGLDVRFGKLHILRNLDLEVPFGELHVLMGPNGSGKSTLCHAHGSSRVRRDRGGRGRRHGHPRVGRRWEVCRRFVRGIPVPGGDPGVTLGDLIAEMADAQGDEILVRAAAAASSLSTEAFLDRSVNVGLSGGEKKRSEMTQLLALAPRMAVLDELDSGLDIDAVREVAGAVQDMRGPDLGVLVITHYTRVLRYLEVDRVHVLLDGRIVESGDRTLADRLDAEGYDGLRKSLGLVGNLPVEDPFAGR